MNLAFQIILPLFFVSILINTYCLMRLAKKQKRPESMELQEFLADLLSGPAIVAVARVDRNEILLRSPKQK